MPYDLITALFDFPDFRVVDLRIEGEPDYRRVVVTLRGLVEPIAAVDADDRGSLNTIATLRKSGTCCGGSGSPSCDSGAIGLIVPIAEPGRRHWTSWTFVSRM